MPSRFNQFLLDYEAEQADQPEFGAEQTLAHFHGAVTRHLRSSSINATMERSRNLNTLLEEAVS